MKELKSILHVDDDEDILDITKMSLELVGGFEVLQSRSADHAFATLDQISPDLILLDVMMPHVDGPTFLKRVRNIARFESMPVIYMTAKSETDLQERLLQDGVLGVVTKPFDPMTLPTQLIELWNGAAGVQAA
ncbi:MAG: response regulator [Pseudomonadota bacterium]